MSMRLQNRRHPARAFRGVILAACALLACAAPVAASIRSAQEAYRAGRFDAARAEYERLLQGRPDDPRLAFNAGTSAFRAGDPESAARHFESATRSRDLGLQAGAFYNLGNSRYLQAESVEDPAVRKGLWEEAARHFATTLSIDPAHEDARANLELVRSRLAGQPPPQQQPQQSPDKQNPDSDDKDGSEEEQGQQQQQQGQQGQEGQQGEQEQPGQGQEGGEGDQERSGQPQGGKDPSENGQGDDSKEDGRASESDPRGAKDRNAGQQKSQEGSGQQGEGRDSSAGRDGDGKDGKEGDAGRVRAAGSPREPGGEGDGQGMAEGGGAAGEMMRMTVRQAEQVLDEQRGEERALIWRPAQTPPESRASGMRRKTW